MLSDGTPLIGQHVPDHVAMGCRHAMSSAVRRSTLQIMDQAQTVPLTKNPAFLKRFNIVTASIAWLIGTLKRGYW